MRYIEYLLFFPGLVLHEALHAAVAFLLFGKINSIRLFPKKENGYFIYGSVTFSAKSNVTILFASIAPIFSLFIFIYSLFFFGFIDNKYNLNIHNPFNSFLLLLLYIYISLQLIWASKLSWQDVKLFLSALFSIEIFLYGIIFYIFFMIKL